MAHRSRLVPTTVAGVLFLAVAALAGPPGQPKPAKPPEGGRKPLKVFILAGQSNMQGHAAVSTFDGMADDPKTAALLKEMRDDEGKPRVCDRVWITSVGCLGDAYSDLREKTGKLTAGFGAPENKIGPEFTFGLTMDKALNEPVLVIKTSWGGRSLHTDFRPPSAGEETINDFTLAQWKKRYPDVDMHTAAVNGNTLNFLAKNASSIQLLVVGHERREGVAALVGPPGLAALQNAECSVLICEPQNVL